MMPKGCFPASPRVDTDLKGNAIHNNGCDPMGASEYTILCLLEDGMGYPLDSMSWGEARVKLVADRQFEGIFDEIPEKTSLTASTWSETASGDTIAIDNRLKQ